MGTQQHLMPFIPDTNAIEALNRQPRKAIKTKGSFPSEEAAIKLIYLAIHNAVPQWTRTRGYEPGRFPRRLRIEDDLSSGQETLRRCHDPGSIRRS